MSDKMVLLEEMFALADKYTRETIRPSIIDLLTYDAIIGMYESDYEDVNTMTYIWRKKPDEIMETIVESDKYLFNLEYGLDSFDEDIREYLQEKGFIVHVDEVTDEEYQTNLEEK